MEKMFIQPQNSLLPGTHSSQFGRIGSRVFNENSFDAVLHNKSSVFDKNNNDISHDNAY